AERPPMPADLRPRLRAGPGPQRLHRHGRGAAQRREGRRALPGHPGQGPMTRTRGPVAGPLASPSWPAQRRLSYSPTGCSADGELLAGYGRRLPVGAEGVLVVDALAGLRAPNRRLHEVQGAGGAYVVDRLALVEERLARRERIARVGPVGDVDDVGVDLGRVIGLGLDRGKGDHVEAVVGVRREGVVKTGGERLVVGGEGWGSAGGSARGHRALDAL